MSEKPNLFLLSKPIVRLLLTRHGETQYNREGRFYGTLDTPLNENGVEQAKVLAKRLTGSSIDTIYASPLIRAQQTAQHVSTALSLPIHTHAELREMDHGAWEGLTFNEAFALDEDVWWDWRVGKVENPHGGETNQQVQDRAAIWVEHVKANHAGETVLCVAHGGVLQAMVCLLMGTPLRPLWQYRFANTAVAEIELYEHGGVLLGFG